MPLPTLDKENQNKSPERMAGSTVTLTCSWYTLQHWSVSPPKDYKPQCNPLPHPTPPQPQQPRTILKYLSALSTAALHRQPAPAWSPAPNPPERRREKGHTVFAVPPSRGVQVYVWTRTWGTSGATTTFITVTIKSFLPTKLPTFEGHSTHLTEPENFPTVGPIKVYPVSSLLQKRHVADVSL